MSGEHVAAARNDARAAGLESARVSLARMEHGIRTLEEAMRERDWTRVELTDQELRDEAEVISRTARSAGDSMGAHAIHELMAGLGAILKRYTHLMSLLTADRDALGAELGDLRRSHRAAASFLDGTGA